MKSECNGYARLWAGSALLPCISYVVEYVVIKDYGMTIHFMLIAVSCTQTFTFKYCLIEESTILKDCILCYILFVMLLVGHVATDRFKMVTFITFPTHVVVSWALRCTFMLISTITMATVITMTANQG